MAGCHTKQVTRPEQFLNDKVGYHDHLNHQSFFLQRNMLVIICKYVYIYIRRYIENYTENNIESIVITYLDYIC